MKFIKYIIFALSILASCTKNLSSSSPKSEIARVKLTGVISRRNIQKIVFGGRVSSLNQFEQVSLIQGTIEKLAVKSGQKVKKGQVLAVIAPVTKGLSFKKYKVKASTDGLVLKAFKEAGSFVSENEVLFTIGGGIEYQADVWGSIDDVLNISSLKRVNIQLAPSSQNSWKLKGELFSVSSLPDEDSGLYNIKISFKCPSDSNNTCNILARNNVWSRVVFEKDMGEVLILKDKFLSRDTKYLLVVSKDDVVIRRDVKLGSVLADGTIVEKGLKDGERIIVSYDRKPNNGDKVEVQ